MIWSHITDLDVFVSLLNLDQIEPLFPFLCLSLTTTLTSISVQCLFKLTGWANIQICGWIKHHPINMLIKGIPPEISHTFYTHQFISTLLLSEAKSTIRGLHLLCHVLRHFIAFPCIKALHLLEANNHLAVQRCVAAFYGCLYMYPAHCFHQCSE